jgi:NADH-quinone oxidoreductase subunit E
MSVESIDLGKMREVIASYDGMIRKSDLMSILKQTQDIYGYLPRVALEEVSRCADIPISRIYGVATFYGHFFLTRRGKYNIRVCRGTACHVRGGKKVLDTVKKTIGINEGETSPDYNFSLETVACLGACALAPVVTINKTSYGKMLPGKIKTILNKCACSGE